MVVASPNLFSTSPRFSGLRLTADEFLRLAPDGHKYELIDGVVILSPSPTFGHQDVRGFIETQVRSHVEPKRLGWIVSEVDVRLSTKVVYRPDLIFVSVEQHATRPRVVDFAPRLVVEVLSPSNAQTDIVTKRDDYERAGVLEYWIVDPTTGSVRVHALERGLFVVSDAGGDSLPSVAIAGFTLDLRRLRELAGE
ncbi:MAG: Uma2 family endonuclease [Phycisphaerales bacterium]|nr:Uma2 family endonuclease [Phycisphaerales bacterium]